MGIVCLDVKPLFLRKLLQNILRFFFICLEILQIKDELILVYFQVTTCVKTIKMAIYTYILERMI